MWGNSRCDHVSERPCLPPERQPGGQSSASILAAARKLHPGSDDRGREPVGDRARQQQREACLVGGRRRDPGGRQLNPTAHPRRGDEPRRRGALESTSREGPRIRMGPLAGDEDRVAVGDRDERADADLVRDRPRRPAVRIERLIDAVVTGPSFGDSLAVGGPVSTFMGFTSGGATLSGMSMIGTCHPALAT